MPDGPALSTAGLLGARAVARRGLLASTAAAVAVAVAAVCAVLGRLAIAVDESSDASRPGVPPDEIAAQVDAGIVALVSAAPALVLLVVIVAGTAAAQLARLLASAREHERANTRARGLSRGQAVQMDAVEAAGVVVIGSVAGLALAAIASSGAALLDGRDAGSAGAAALASLAFWWVGVVTALVLGTVLVVAARGRAQAAGRGARTATASVLVLVVLAAAFAAWQLRAARPTGFDPIAALAPTLLLLAGAIAALAVVGAGAAAGVALAAARPAFAPSYPARQVARRLSIYAVAVLLVALTTSQAVFTAAYSATWTAMATDSSALRAGADLRVDLEPQTSSPEIVAAAAGTAGVSAAAPALVTSVEIGDSDAELVAVPTEAIPIVVTAAGGAVDRDALLAGVAPGPDNVAAEFVPLPVDAEVVRLTATVESGRSDAADGVRLSATVVDSTGAAAQVRLRPAQTIAANGTTLIVEGALPDGAAPWSVVSVTAAIDAAFGSTDMLVTLVDVRAAGADPLPIQGRSQLGENAREQVLWLGDAGDDRSEPAPVRAVLTAGLADRLGLAVGDSVEFRYSGSGRRGQIEVGALVPAIPGASTSLALFAPLEVLQVSQLQRGTSIVPAASVWAAGDPSADVTLSAALEDRPVRTAAPGVTAAVVGALAPGWWIATGGSAVLSLIAAFAIVQALALARRRELGVLRALGVARGEQARTRAVELGAVMGTALVLGAVAGGFVAWLIVPALVRATTPGILPLGEGVVFSWPALALALGVLMAGLAAVVGGLASGVRSAAATATVGEEAR